MKIADRLKKSFGRKRESIRFAGDFKSWNEAERLSTGYAAPEILQKTRAAEAGLEKMDKFCSRAFNLSVKLFILAN